jgi:hypothetical protein
LSQHHQLESHRRHAIVVNGQKLGGKKSFSPRQDEIKSIESESFFFRACNQPRKIVDAETKKMKKKKAKPK